MGVAGRGLRPMTKGRLGVLKPGRVNNYPCHCKLLFLSTPPELSVKPGSADGIIEMSDDDKVRQVKNFEV